MNGPHQCSTPSASHWRLDRDDDEAGNFEVRNSIDTTVFDVDESGNVRVNGTVVHSSDRDRKENFAAVESGAILEGEELARAEKVAADLGKVFCRRCGYCMPCPNGIPITFPGIIFPSLAKRLPRESVAGGPARTMVEKVSECTECGECVEKCPYDLPIPDILKEHVELARTFLDDTTTNAT